MNKMDMLEAINGELCIIDDRGNVLVEPKVAIDTIAYPSHGFIQVGKDGKYGYMNETGELVIPMQYTEAYPFSENGLAFVKEDNGLGGYIDKSGEYVIEPIYESGSTFKFGFAAVSKNGEYIYIYKNGQKAINNTFKYASGFANCGLATIQTLDGKYGLMDTTSRQVLTLKKGCELAEFKEDGRITTFSHNGRKALIDASGKIITGFNYEEVIVSPYERLHPFLRNGLWGYIDSRGNEVIPNIYREASEFSDDFTDDPVAFVKAFHPLVENNIRELYINEEDEIINSNYVENRKRFRTRRYSQITPYKKGLALAVKSDEEDRLEKIREAITNGLTPAEEAEYSLRIAKERKEKKEFMKRWNIVPNSEKEFNECSLHEVEVEFKNMKENEIPKFLEENLGGELEILEMEDHYVRFLCFLDASYDPAEIDVVLYDTFGDYELGTYTSYEIG